MILDAQGRQVLGLTADEAARLAKQGVTEFSFGEYKLRTIVDESAQPLPETRVHALPLDLEV
jgi:hypothetical protein